MPPFTLSILSSWKCWPTMLQNLSQVSGSNKFKSFGTQKAWLNRCDNLPWPWNCQSLRPWLTTIWPSTTPTSIPYAEVWCEARLTTACNVSWWCAIFCRPSGAWKRATCPTILATGLAMKAPAQFSAKPNSNGCRRWFRWTSSRSVISVWIPINKSNRFWYVLAMIPTSLTGWPSMSWKKLTNWLILLRPPSLLCQSDAPVLVR